MLLFSPPSLPSLPRGTYSQTSPRVLARGPLSLITMGLFCLSGLTWPMRLGPTSGAHVFPRLSEPTRQTGTFSPRGARSTVCLPSLPMLKPSWHSLSIKQGK